MIAAGGLFVIGTERHESRRIDNQLRGRSGRQGDPGASSFFVSLEDDLMRIFGSERMDGMLRKLGLEEGEAIVHPWVNKALEKAQQKVEARNFEIRKQLLKYDDVMNDQRKVIYEQRKEIMGAQDVSEDVADMRRQVAANSVARCIPSGAYHEQWDIDGLHEETRRLLGLDLPIADWAKEEGIADEEIGERILAASDRRMAERAANTGPEVMRLVEKSLLLQLLDQTWKDHLLSLDHLRQGIGLRAYGQRDPLNEYKREAFNLFEEMLDRLRERVTEVLSHVELRVTAEAADDLLPERRPLRTQEGRTDPALVAAGANGGGGPARGNGQAPAPRPSVRRAPAAVMDPHDSSTWARCRAIRPAPAARARSTSTATAKWPERPPAG